VGQSIDIARRRKNHFVALSRRVSKHRHLQNSFIKYGGESFEFRILEETLPDMLDIREKAWIAYYCCCDGRFGYNESAGGVFTHEVSAETRRKMSNSHRGLVTSEEGRRNLSLALTGRPVSDETRRKIASAHLGKSMPAEIKRKISLALRGRYCSPETRKKLRDACQGRVFSAETRRKIGDAHRGKVLSEETRKKMSDVRRGKRPSAETRLRLVAAWVKRRQKLVHTPL
jgi:group I intron endonuclease